MTIITYDDAYFREVFPQFASTAFFPESRIQTNWDMAINFISDENGGAYCGSLNFNQQKLAINYMTAHLLALFSIIDTGQTTGVIQSATIDKISVTYMPPPMRDEWRWWLSQTPYGQQLLALLSTLAVGGFYYGGRPELASFRRASWVM
jgi:hypothetical protein